ncbi:DUF6056 family protein [Enterobacter sp. ENT03]|uniref:DUF6056 family protein n=1 Tax=Enterobacter sp. ENT03 TaxID=2854780 RepID=UPI001C43943D|nr:DUF6056 family protein [Enterobacter sp. ENT03]
MFAKVDYIKIFCFLFIIMVCFNVFFSVSYRLTADDQYFINALDDRNLLSFIHERYMTWSGRWSIEAITALTIPHIWLVKIMIPSFLMLSAFFISKICFHESDIRHVSISLASILLIPHGIYEDSISWITGFYNYLLPASLGLFFFYTFVNEYPKSLKTLSVLSLIIVCNHEQVSLALIMASVFFLLSKKGRFSAYRIISLLVMVANFVILVIAPGNFKRVVSESTLRMPEYFDLNFLDKVSMGYDRLNALFFMNGNYVILIICVVLLWSLLTMQTKKSNDIISIVILMAFIACMILLNYNGIKSPLIGIVQEYKGFSPFTIIPSYISLAFIVITMCYVISQRLANYNLIIGSIVIAIATVIAIGFSPTAYASGMRVLFVAEILLVMTSLMIISRSQFLACKINAISATFIASAFIFLTKS